MVATTNNQNQRHKTNADFKPILRLKTIAHNKRKKPTQSITKIISLK